MFNFLRKKKEKTEHEKWRKSYQRRFGDETEEQVEERKAKSVFIDKVWRLKYDFEVQQGYPATVLFVPVAELGSLPIPIDCLFNGTFLGLKIMAHAGPFEVSSFLAEY